MLKKTIAAIAILIGLGYGQEKPRETKLFHPDSTITTTLEEITITSQQQKKENNTITSQVIKGFYYNDPNRALTYKPGVTSILPILAENTIDNMPSELTGTYYGKDMSIPMLGTKTTFQGGASTLNPDLFEMELQQDGYSSSTSNVGGVKRFYSKQKTNGLEIIASGDITDRKITGTTTNTELLGTKSNLGISYRQVKILPQISRIIKELEMLPKVTEISLTEKTTIGELHTEFYFLNLTQTQEYKGQNEWGLEKINQDIKHNFAVAKITKNNDENKIKLAASYEYEDTKIKENQIEAKNNTKNITINAEITNKKETQRIGIASYFFRQRNLNGITRDIYSIYAETKEIWGQFLMEPTIAVSYYKNKIGPSGTLKATTFIQDTEIQAGISRYTTFLIDNQNILGRGNYNKKEEKPTQSHQAYIKINTKQFKTNLELSLFYKQFSTEYLNEGQVQGYSKGIRILIENSDLNSAITGFISDSKINNHKIGGTSDTELQYITWINITKEFNITGMLTYRTGLWTKNKQTQEYQKLKDIMNLNIGINTKINILDTELELSLTGFNLLKPIGQEHELIRLQRQDGTYTTENAPLWGNIQISAKKRF